MPTTWSRTLTTPQPRRFRLILTELEIVASEELADVLRAWPTLTDLQADRLARYLREECGPAGLLSEQARREAGFHGSTAAAIERQGLRLARELADRHNLSTT